MARRTTTITAALEDFDLALAQKTLRGPNNTTMEGVLVQGRHPGLTASAEALQNGPETSFYLPSAVDTYQIASGGNAADDVAGAGARSVKLTGILADLTLGASTLVTAGASTSAVSASFWRVFKAEVINAGTYGGSNTGDVVIESTTGTNETLRIDAGVGESESAVFSTPSNRAGYVRAYTWHHEGLTTDPATFDIFLRPNFDDASVPVSAVRRIRRFGGLTRLEHRMLLTQIVIPPKSDFWVDAFAAVGTPPLLVAFDITLAPFYS